MVAQYLAAPFAIENVVSAPRPREDLNARGDAQRNLRPSLDLASTLKDVHSVVSEGRESQAETS